MSASPWYDQSQKITTVKKAKYKYKALKLTSYETLECATYKAMEQAKYEANPPGRPL